MKKERCLSTEANLAWARKSSPVASKTKRYLTEEQLVILNDLRHELGLERLHDVSNLQDYSSAVYDCYVACKHEGKGE
jgi:hypothetical protein